MQTVTASNAHEFDKDKFVTEASQLGLPPGTWPMTLQTTLGNGQVFIRKNRKEDGGFDYLQGNGCIRLTVLND